MALDYLRRQMAPMRNVRIEEREEHRNWQGGRYQGHLKPPAGSLRRCGCRGTEDGIDVARGCGVHSGAPRPSGGECATCGGVAAIHAGRGWRDWMLVQRCPECDPQPEPLNCDELRRRYVPCARSWDRIRREPWWSGRRVQYERDVG